jgi:hypothetical protein
VDLGPARGAETGSQSAAERAWPLAQDPTRADWTTERDTQASAARWSGRDPGEPGRSRPTGPMHELETLPPFPRAPSIPVVPSTNPSPQPRLALQPQSAVPLRPLPGPFHWPPWAPASVLQVKSQLINHIGPDDGQPGVCAVCQGQPLSADAHMGWPSSKVLGMEFGTRFDTDSWPKGSNATESRQSGTRHLEPCCQRQKSQAPSVQLDDSKKGSQAPKKVLCTARAVRSEGRLRFNAKRSRMAGGRGTADHVKQDPTCTHARARSGLTVAGSGDCSSQSQ